MVRFSDLKEWIGTLGEAELAVPLTAHNLLGACDPRMADLLDEFLGSIFMNNPDDNLREQAMKLLVLLHIPIG